MREALGVALDPARIVSLRHDTYDDSSRWHEYDATWHTPAEDFALTEGQRYGWFTLADALVFSDLAEHALGSVDVSRERLACKHGVAIGFMPRGTASRSAAAHAPPRPSG